MKACFKKGEWNQFYAFWIMLKNYADRLISDGIKHRQEKELVHAEIYFDNTVHEMSWSSSEDDKGTRAKTINYSHPERWKMLNISIKFVNKLYSEITDPKDVRYGKQFVDEQELFNFLQNIKRNYDWSLIGHFVLPLIGSNKKDLVCSEAVMFGLGYRLKKYNEITPMLAYELLSNDLKEFYSSDIIQDKG